MLSTSQGGGASPCLVPLRGEMPHRAEYLCALGGDLGALDGGLGTLLLLGCGKKGAETRSTEDEDQGGDP